MGNRTRIDETENLPTERGFYLVYADGPIGWMAVDSTSDPVYVGKADDGLRRRIEREHGGDTGRSTLRRSLGALLKEELDLVARPRPGKGELKSINFTNYSFEPDGDKRLTEWMVANLTVDPITMPTATSERELIAHHQPLLNLTGWANPHGAEIKAARKHCAAEARRRSAADP